jgi:hypothetical protein
VVQVDVHVNLNDSSQGEASVMVSTTVYGTVRRVRFPAAPLFDPFVAQLAEQEALNFEVVGSSPTEWTVRGCRMIGW